MFIRVANLFPPEGGEVDYKGLDIDKFVHQSQSYNFLDGSVVLETTEQLDVSTLEDVQVLTQDEYISFVDLHKQLQPTPEESQHREMEALKAENQALNTAVVELYEIVLGGI